MTEKEISKTDKDKEDIDNLKFPEDVGNGPIKNRVCTDIFFCIFFIVFCVGMVAASIYGWIYGNPGLLLIGWDSDKNGCGYSEATLEYPFLYWPKSPDSETVTQVNAGNYDEIIGLLSHGVCVKECPLTVDAPIDCFPTKAMLDDYRYKDCVYYPAAIDLRPIPVIYDTSTAFRYASKSAAGGFCMPDGDAASSEAGQDAIVAMKKAFYESTYGQKVIVWTTDIMRSWFVILVVAVISLFLGYLYLFVIRIMGGAIIWVTFVLLVLVLLGAGFYSYFKAGEYEVEDPYNQYLKYAAYILWVLDVIVLFSLCCCYQAIKLGIAIFKTTSMYVQHNMKIFTLPFIMFILELVWASFWIFCAIYIFSVGTPESHPDYEFVTNIKWTTKTRYTFLYHIFGLFWLNAFIVGVTQFIIGCSACLWYFEVSTDTKGTNTLSRAFYWTFRYHLGSIAFGSFCIAVCQIIRFLFEYYRRKIGAANKELKWVKVMLCLTGALLYMMERCVKYITKNAYIQISLQNTAFFQSAWNAFTLMLKHAHRFGLGNSIGFIYMLFGCGAIASLSSFAGYIFITSYPALEIVEPIAPTVAMAVVSSLIAYTFLSIFSFSSDAIFQSFLLDEEMRMAGRDRPEYLQEFADDLKNRGKGCCEGSCF